MKNLLENIVNNKNQSSQESLKKLVEAIRPDKRNDVNQARDNIQNLIAHLKLEPKYGVALSRKLIDLFHPYDPVYIFTESGILSDRGFFSELWRKFKHKILPELVVSNSTMYLLNEIFHRKDDYLWMKKVPQDIWIELLDLLNIKNLLLESKDSKNALFSAMELLSHRIAALGLDKDIIQKLKHLDKRDSPFLIQNQTLILFIKSLSEGTIKTENNLNEKYQALDLLLSRCKDSIVELHQRRDEFGTSLHLTMISKRLIQMIDRLNLLIRLVYAKDKNSFYQDFIKLSLQVIRAAGTRNNLAKFINDHADLLAFEMVEHTAKKGGRYIAENAKEYWSYLRASMLGGLLIAIFAILKVFIDAWSISPLGQGLLYSMNYAICFVLVYLFGGIIATKQPAMTASSVARSVDSNDDGNIDNLPGLKDLIIKVSRSQFISFVGNLILAIPVAYLISVLMSEIFGLALASPEKSSKLLAEIHPLESGALYYAGIAGIFLSLSGLVSGYFSNKLVYSKIPERLIDHPFLKDFSLNKRKQLAQFINKHLGALAGNISLGFFLGMAGTIGFITGLPFDIRHIAFSSANFGLAIANLELQSILPVLFMLGIGILGIGLMNFSVSFGMTLFIALKSRKSTFGQTKQLIKLIFRHFIVKPMDFFLQPGIIGRETKKITVKKINIKKHE